MEKPIKYIPSKRNLLIEKKGHKSFLASENSYLFKIEDSSQIIRYYKCLIPNLNKILSMDKKDKFYNYVLGRSRETLITPKELSIETYYDNDEKTLKDFAFFFNYFLDYLNKTIYKKKYNEEFSNKNLDKFSCTILCFNSDSECYKSIRLNGCTLIHIRTFHERLSNNFYISFNEHIETEFN